MSTDLDVTPESADDQSSQESQASCQTASESMRIVVVGDDNVAGVARRALAGQALVTVLGAGHLSPLVLGNALKLEALHTVVEPWLSEQRHMPVYGSDRPYLRKKKGRS